MGIQTKTLTHTSEGALKAPSEKEFLDFKFDGKYISEFGWVVVHDNDRHEFNSHAEFTDETTEINGVPGQQYWGTQMKILNRTFKLATDGVTEKEIEELRMHFAPGKIGEFIEDKMAHRKGYCRIDKPISFSVVPFQKTINIGKEITVNFYKGEATISFVFDQPFLQATENYLLSQDNENYRVAYLNNTPFLDSLGEYTNQEGAPSEFSLNYNIGTMVELEGDKIITNNFYGLDESGKKKTLKFYNPSLFPTAAKLSITFVPSINETEAKDFFAPDNNTAIYFSELADEFNNGVSPYNSIQCINNIKTFSETLLKFTTPNIIYNLHKAIHIAQQFYVVNPTGAVIDLQDKLRLEILNSDVLAWAMKILRIIMTKEDYYNSETGIFKTGTIPINKGWLVPINNNDTFNGNWFKYYNIFMLSFLRDYHKDTKSTATQALEQMDCSKSYNSYTINFDGIKGEVLLNYKHNAFSTIDPDTDTINSITNTINSGEMLRSAHLKLPYGNTLFFSQEKGSLPTLATYYELAFYRGNDSASFEDITLEYNHIY